MAHVSTRHYVMLLAITAGLVVTMGQAQTRGATSALFVIDPINSSVSASGTLGSSPIRPQGPDSLTASYSGAIVADLDLDAGTILFRAETVITAADSGNWQPLRGGDRGSEPANYGGLATFLVFPFRAALRDVKFSIVTDQALPLTPIGEGLYAFESTQRIPVISGVFDYEAELLGFGSQDMAGYATQNSGALGTLQDNGDGTFYVIVPVNFTISATFSAGVPLTVNLNGVITGLTVP